MRCGWPVLSLPAPQHTTPCVPHPGTSPQLTNATALCVTVVFVIVHRTRGIYPIYFVSPPLDPLDPWFNYRATRVLASKGFYVLVGGTIYPGLMATSGVIYNALHALHLPVNIQYVCVLLAPGFSALTAWATYIAGLLAAAFIGIVPGYISHSVAGSYDNEAIANFHQASALYDTLAAVFYFYMVAAWGGYAFITNMIPLHALALTLMGYYTNCFIMQVPFIGFQPVSCLLQIVAFVELVQSHVSSKQFQQLLFASVVAAGLLGTLAIVGLTYKGWIAPWTGLFYSLWDTGYVKKYIPIIASVSEHQPTAWPSFFMDCHFLIFLFPAGVVLCFKQLRGEHVFVIIYTLVVSYFAGVMVQLMLTLTPIVCVSAAADKSKKDKSTAPSASGTSVAELLTEMVTSGSSTPKKAKPAQRRIFGLDTRAAVIVNALARLTFFVVHCTWVTSMAYSSPSVVLASHNQDSLQLIDDFRESWWEYGYQIADMADCPTLVDNNTRNNTHIATVGKAMSSSEEVAYPNLRKHDIDYVPVIFGEPWYFTPQRDYRVDVQASPTMKNSLMYKMSYYRFVELFGNENAQDRVRGQKIPSPGTTLDYLEEAFTSENWIPPVRITQSYQEISTSNQ
ncbi:Oligosaccharyl transferase STT3 subunit [Lactarius tabidus]